MKKNVKTVFSSFDCLESSIHTQYVQFSLRLGFRVCSRGKTIHVIQFNNNEKKDGNTPRTPIETRREKNAWKL